MDRPALNLFVGFIVAVAGGLIGLGGAELRLPFIVGVLGISAHAAVPANLAISLVTVAAALPLRLHGLDLDHLMPWLPIVLALAGGAMAAAYVGAGWLRTISPALLGRLIAALLILLGAVMVAEAAWPLIPTGLLPDRQPVRIAAGVIFGSAIGTISSLLGVAGGEVIIPTLVVGYGVPVALAGTLSLLISTPTIVVGMARHAAAGAFRDRHIARSVIVPMAAGALFGAPIGAALAAFAPAALLKLLLGGLLIWSAAKVFARPGDH